MQLVTQVAYALLILAASWVIGGWLRATAQSALARTRLDPMVSRLIARMVRPLVLIVGLMAALNQLGVETNSVVALLGGAALAIGLALQGSLSHVASGAMILTLRPFNVGDEVLIGGTLGVVEELGLFSSRVLTPDGVTKFVPNSTITGGVIENFSRHGKRRVQEIFPIAHKGDLDLARETLLAQVQADERFHAEPAPKVLVTSLSWSGVELQVRAWVDSANWAPASAAIRESGKKALDAAGVPIPSASASWIRLDGAEPAASKPAAKRSTRKKSPAKTS